MVVLWNFHLPMSIVARYVAIGCFSVHWKELMPALVPWPVRSPLATTLVPEGTEMLKVKVALSLGWSFDGNHVLAALGSHPTNAPSVV